MTAALLVMTTPAGGANADATFAPQTAHVEIDTNGSPYWAASVTFAPSVEVFDGDLTLRFGQPPPVVTVNESSDNCQSPPGSIHACRDDWQYPEQHVTHITLVFDNGARTDRDLVLTDSGTVQMPIADGARAITSVTATLGDGVTDWIGNGADVHYEASRHAAVLTFPGPIELAGSGSSGVTGPAGPSTTASPSTGSSTGPALVVGALVALGLVVAGIVVVARRRRDRPVGPTRTIGDRTPNSIIEDGEGNLWQAHLDGGTWHYHFISHESEPSEWAKAGRPTHPIGLTNSILGDPSANDLVEDERGNVWHAHLDGGAWIYDFVSMMTEPSAWAQAGHPVQPEGVTRSILGGPSPNDLVEDERGHLWHAWLEGGAWHYHLMEPPPP